MTPPPDDLAPEPREPGDDGILDIELGDEADEPLPPVTPSPGGVLDLTLDDLAEDSAPVPYPGVSDFPAVTAEQVSAAKPGVTVPCVCSATREGFDVRYEEREPGVFWAVETTRTTAKGAKGGFAGAQSAVQGSFRMGPDYHCPYCGSDALTICEGCQAVLCLGALTKQGDCPCPGCGATLTPSGTANAAPARGKGKGGKGKGW